MIRIVLRRFSSECPNHLKFKGGVYKGILTENVPAFALMLIFVALFGCSPLAYSLTSTTTTLSSSLNPSTYGSTVTFTAKVSPSAATGTVTFKNNGTSIGTANLSGGTATFQISTLAVGSNPMTASYGGNSTYSGSTSSTLTQTVNKANSTTSLSSSLNPSTYGASVTFTATVTPTPQRAPLPSRTMAPR